MKRKSKTREGEVALPARLPATAVTPLTGTIDAEFETVPPASDPPPSTLKSQGFFDSLNFADAVLAIAAVTAVGDLAAHKGGLAVWLIIFGSALRAKMLLLKRMPVTWPDWLAEIVAYGLPSAVLWTAVMWAT